VETVPTRPDTVYRSLLQMCGRCTDVRPVTDCSFYLHVVYPANKIAI